MDYYEQNKSNADYNNLSNGNEDENFLYWHYKISKAKIKWGKNRQDSEFLILN
jgi:hypothetical protein